MVNLEPVQGVWVFLSAVSRGARGEVGHCWPAVGIRPCCPEEFNFRASGGWGGEHARLGVDVADYGFGGDIFNGTVVGNAPADAFGDGVLIDVEEGLVTTVAAVGLVFGFGFWQMGGGTSCRR